MKNNLLDTAENALLEILKREITGLDRTEKTELSVAGLKTVMRLAKEHTVTGLVANAAVRNRIVIAGGAAEGRGEAVMKLMQLDRENKDRLYLIYMNTGLDLVLLQKECLMIGVLLLLGRISEINHLNLLFRML